MKVLAAKLNKVCHNSVSAISLSILACPRTELFNDCCLFFLREQVRHFTTVKKIIYIFKEGLFDDLSIREEENLRLTLNT